MKYRTPTVGVFLVAVLAAASLTTGCSSTSKTSKSSSANDYSDVTLSSDRQQYPSTYKRHEYPPVVIRNATIMTATGQEIEGGAIYFKDGRIVAVGADIDVPTDAKVVDGTGKFVTPGLIDTHSHLGVYAAPGTEAESDGNEYPVNNGITPNVWAEHSIWPQDPQMPRAVAGGVTTIQVLPGSANLIGGRSAVIKLIPATSVQEMKFPGAPYGLKMACGENPKRVYGNRGGPTTRMGNMAGYRKAFADAEAYKLQYDAWLKDRSKKPPQRDLGLETLAEVLDGKIAVHNHCYRADEMVQMIDLSKEFGFEIRSFHHAVEAYKIADILAANDISASVWSDWWGFKDESMDGIPENAAILNAKGARAIIHSDSENGIQRLNQGAAQAMFDGIAAGIPVSRNDALRWITANPAWALKIEEVTGTLEVGKMADVVLWDGDPFSIYTLAEQVYNDGWLVFDRDHPESNWRTDFELGQVRR